MPKVISGILKGRNIKGFDIEGTRPTMDRVKESVFAMIQSDITNSVVLDLFAGSGNLGIEALSNGADKVYFNDYNKKCIKIIKENLENFGILDKTFLTNLDYVDAINYYCNHKILFDIIFIDPPYKDKIMKNLLEMIIKKEIIKDGSLVVCETLDNSEYISDDYVLYKEKKYGDKFILIYKCCKKM